ncbi:MAG: methylenetetrahydrofolate reductase [NAD(P)H] [Coriobacteriaceae bacterium]|nr:MAG: methylenetetrahydrofolate reductase [NAD(P)H] [Coriobacteriaceae bacterium]
MRIDDILKGKQTFSFEIFPPKGDMSVQQATAIADELTLNHPDWISVTFSAGGSGNSQHTVGVAKAIQQAGKTQALAHLTCLGSSKQDVDAYVQAIKDAGVQNVLALRGDRVPGREAIDFEHASDLVSYLKGTGLCVGAACYPEGHVESASLREDVEHLKAKVDAGADFLVTQLFFNNDDFYRFRDLLVRAHIKVPVVVGIMPFTSVQQIQRMAFTCGASIPSKVIKRLVAAGDDKEAQRRAGVAYACEQLVDLAQNGVDGLHIYTMNRPSIGRATHDCLLKAGYLKE